MDFEQNKRRQSLRLIISEIIMVLAVILTVIFLALIVSGYWLNSDFEVERQGMLQVYSTPTGADVQIDGQSSWLQRTNTSKVLPSGEHTVSLTREGYDSWSKEINITEGLLYRLHYPRLFLKDRETEKVFNTAGAMQATVSPDHTKLILMDGTTGWKLIDLGNEKIEAEKMNIAKVFQNVSVAEGAEVGLMKGQISQISWSRDNSHILMRLDSDETQEWVILDIDNLENSINLTKEFGVNFDQVKILNDSATNLLTLQGGRLRRLDVGSKQISAVLAENVMSFDYFANEVLYVTKNEGSLYEVNILKLNEDQADLVQEIDVPAIVALNKFYDDKYIIIVTGNLLSLYNMDDFSLKAEYTLSFDPAKIKVGYAGGFIELYKDNLVVTLDMEAMKMREWQLPNNNFGWIDNNMLYSVENGELSVYDFDGFNHRVLAKSVSDHFPVIITDDRWLYYFSDDNLVREWLVPR